MKKVVFNPKHLDLNLNENEIHIWNIDLDHIRKSTSSITKILSEEEISRANKFHFESDKERFICNRGILRFFINTYTKIPLKTISYIQNDFGKPELSESLNDNRLNFNVSHSKNIFCLAFCRKEQVGIDTEIVKPISNYMQIAERYFSESELEKLKSLSEKDKLGGFYTCWTSKEAVIKLLGQGLSFPLKDFDVQIKNLEVGENHRYQVNTKNEEEIISVEVFKPVVNVFGACAVNIENYNTIYFEFDERVYSVKNFLSDNL